MKYSILSLGALLIFSCNNPGKVEKGNAMDSVPANAATYSSPEKDTVSASPKMPSPNENAVFEVKTFDNSKNVAGTNFTGWGYDIYIDGKLTIRQPNRPAVPGNAGCKTEAQAKKVGEFMANKIRHNVMPPTVDKLELASMGVDTSYTK
jgi:hypothetical protein